MQKCQVIFYRALRLHDVVRKYLIKKQEEKLPPIHERFLDSYELKRWCDLPESEFYLWAHLAYHLVKGGREVEMRRLLFDFDWIWAKLTATDVNSLIANYDYLSDDSDLRQVQGAIRMSAHVLARDKTQFAGQLLGRLQSFDVPEIQSMLKQARGWEGGVWLCPLTACLTSPGGPLMRTLEGHTDWVDAVAVTPDGKHAISGSYDNTLRVWDIDSGEEIQKLEGHTYWVKAVAITPDGKHAISGSMDETLRVWDIETGKTIASFSGNGPLHACAISPDGVTIVAGEESGRVHFLHLHGVE